MFRPSLILACALTAAPVYAQLGSELDESEKQKIAEPADDKVSSSSSGSGEATADTGFRGDRVRSVQKKPYLKRGRFALTALGGTALNDPFHTKLSGAAGLQFFLKDTLAVGVRGALFSSMLADDAQTAKANFQSAIVASRPSWSAVAELEWSPLYGKVKFGNSILHLDGLLSGGVGAVNAGSPEMAFSLGAGLRLVAKDWLAVRVGVENLSYVATPEFSTLGLIQNLFSVSVGVSLFIPFSSVGGSP